MQSKRVQPGAVMVPNRALSPAAIARRRRVFKESTVDHHVLFDGVTVIHKGRRSRSLVFDGMTAVIPKGRRVAIMGPRRSGKTTLARLIAGTVVPNAGEVVRRTEVSWPVGGQYFISSLLTVRENIRFCAALLGFPQRELMSYLDELCGFGHRLDERLGNLPGLYKNRMAIALPLSLEFDCFLVDEQVKFKAAQFTPDREDFLKTQFMKQDLILITRNKKVALEFCDTGAVIRSGHIVYCRTLKEAIDEAVANDGPGEPTIDREAEDEDEQDDLYGAW